MRDTSERNEGVQKILPAVGRVCVSVCSGRIDVRPCDLQLLALSSHSTLPLRNHLQQVLPLMLQTHVACDTLPWDTDPEDLFLLFDRWNTYAGRVK